MVEKTHSGGMWPTLADPFRAFGTRLADWFAPASEASTSGDDYTITVELPGVAEEDITLSAHDGLVTLKGENKTEKEEIGKTWYFSERQYAAFSRTFRLPPEADEDKVSADLKDGVLTIRVPKKLAEEPVDRRVKINAG